MAPTTQRRVVARDRFSVLFSSLKSQQYVDPLIRITQPPVHRTLAWNASGTQIATGSTDRTIRVWNPEKNTPKSQMKLDGHGGTVEKIVFNPMQEFELASASRDGTVKFWDTRSRSCTGTVTLGDEVLTLAWSGDGSVLVAGTKVPKDSEPFDQSGYLLTLQSDVLTTISTNAPSTPTILAKHPQKIRTNQTTFSNACPPQDLLITQGEGVQILDYPSFTPLHTLAGHTSSCTAIAYSPLGNYVAVGGSDALISLWDTTNWACARTVSNPTTGKVNTVSWSWDGRYLFGSSEEIAGATDRSGFDIYHAETGEAVHTIVTGKHGISAAEWHPSRYWLAYTLIEEKPTRSVLHIVGPGGGPVI